MYEVSFTQASDESARNTLASEQERGGLSLNEVIALCTDYGVGAKLLDESGFTKGYVHADGTYSLT
ncbi:MAG: hypothetical protein RIS45_1668 [Planctomycetota bacterium]|jgi:hypothetical protein